jgi:uncharacterized phage protein gp47/JayE
VDSTGLTRPAFTDIMDTLQSLFQGIYGTDAYIDPDSKDGQMLAIVAKAVDDSNAQAQAVYTSFSPATAQGAALSSNVKINGLARKIASNSTALVNCVGQVGTVINGGQVQDASGNIWSIPDGTIIPSAGTVQVTATCLTEGAITAPAGTIDVINTPTLGWQSVSNPSDAVPGAPVESDAALRIRQSQSTSLPAQTPLAAVSAAVAACAGVTQVKAYENDGSTTDSNGLPAHSICLVTVGGAAADIGAAIQQKKCPGTTSFGSTSQSVTDPGTGITYTIKYTPAAPVPMGVVINIKALAGYTSTIGAEIIAAVVAYVNALGIGQSSYLARLYLPAQLGAIGDGATFELQSITQGTLAGPWTAADFAIAYNQIATLTSGGVTLNVS